MTLRDHLKAEGETVTAFALRLGEARNTINKIVYGQRQPSLPLADKIVRETGGKVGLADLLGSPNRERASDDRAAA